MQSLYFILAAIHLVAIIVTGVLWTAYDLGFQTKLRPHLRDVRAVHFGSLYLVPSGLTPWRAVDCSPGRQRERLR